MAPVMAELPTKKLDASTGFASVGVDYFYPFTVKIVRRNEKRWCYLFPSLKVRAVVPKLDIDSCLNAVNGLIARRGKTDKKLSATMGQTSLGQIDKSKRRAAWNSE